MYCTVCTSTCVIFLIKRIVVIVQVPGSFKSVAPQTRERDRTSIVERGCQRHQLRGNERVRSRREAGE
jgi:hypothetical protein